MKEQPWLIKFGKKIWIIGGTAAAKEKIRQTLRAKRKKRPRRVINLNNRQMSFIDFLVARGVDTWTN